MGELTGTIILSVQMRIVAVDSNLKAVKGKVSNCIIKHVSSKWNSNTQDWGDKKLYDTCWRLSYMAIISVPAEESVELFPDGKI